MRHRKQIERLELLLSLIAYLGGDLKAIKKIWLEDTGLKERSFYNCLNTLIDLGLVIRKGKSKAVYREDTNISLFFAKTEKVGRKVGNCQNDSVWKPKDIKRVKIYWLATLGHPECDIAKITGYSQSTVNYHLQKLVEIKALKPVGTETPRTYVKNVNSNEMDERLKAYWEREETIEDTKKICKTKEIAKTPEKVGNTDDLLTPSGAVETEGVGDGVVVGDWCPGVPLEIQGCMYVFEIFEEFVIPEDVERWENDRGAYGFKLVVPFDEFPFSRVVYFNKKSEADGGGWSGWFVLPPIRVGKVGFREVLQRREGLTQDVGNAVGRVLGLGQAPLVLPLVGDDGLPKRNINVAFSFPEGFFGDVGFVRGDDWSYWVDETPFPGTWETRDLELGEVMAELPRVVRDNRNMLRGLGGRLDVFKQVLGGIERRMVFFDGRLDGFWRELRAVKGLVDTRMNTLETQQMELIKSTKENNQLLQRLIAELQKGSGKDLYEPSDEDDDEVMFL